MELIQDEPISGIVVQSYQPGQLVVGDKSYSAPVVLTSDSVAPWEAASLVELNCSHFEALLVHNPEVILVGTGDRFVWIDEQLYEVCQRRGIGVECMDSLAASRTFTALRSEGRNVLAALFV